MSRRKLKIECLIAGFNEFFIDVSAVQSENPNFIVYTSSKNHFVTRFPRDVGNLVH